MSAKVFEMASQLQQLSEQYKCSHQRSEVRRRTLSDYSIQYVHQCLRCGRAVGHPISKNKINSEIVNKFDEQLKSQWEEEYKTKKRNILGADHETNKKDLSNFWEWYGEYLRSPEWEKKRRKILFRANNICEGCGENKAVEVHHLSYKHKGNEFLFELVALCKKCHEIVHCEHKNKSIVEINRL